LAWIRNGRVEVESKDGDTIATVSASVAPLLFLPAFAVVLFAAGHLAPIVGAFVLLLTPLTYVSCSDSLETTATAALKPDVRTLSG